MDTAHLAAQAHVIAYLQSGCSHREVQDCIIRFTTVLSAMGLCLTKAATRVWTSGEAEACSHDESVVPLFMCMAVMWAHKSLAMAGLQ